MGRKGWKEDMAEMKNCERCRHYRLARNDCNLRECDKREWILVNERLPEDGHWAIFTTGKDQSVERYKMDCIDHFFPPGILFDLEDAIAWKPIP